MSSPGSPRQVRRRRSQRIAAVSLVATASLLGTYLGTLRPQPTYAAPGGGQVGTRNGLAPPAAPLSGCEQVTGTKTYVDDDTTLQAAITSSVDGDIICITGTSGFRLSQTMVIDDTSITLMGDDSTITLLPAQDGDDTSLRHLEVDLYGGGDDSVIIRSLTFAGDDTVLDDGGAIYFKGGLIAERDEMVIYDSVFRNNIARARGGAIFAGDRLTIYNSVLTDNGAEDGGAIYSDDLVDVTGSLFTGNQANYGGAIYIESRALDVYSSTFRGNRAIRDQVGDGGYGGAIYSEANASIDVHDSVFDANTAETRGGALYLKDDEWHIYTSTFMDNRVTSGDDTALGGAIYAIEGDLYIETSYFANNYAVKGGGIAVAMLDDGSYQRFDVEQSAFVGNDAKEAGAGVYAAVPDDDRMLVTNSSFIVNGDDTAPNYGGAVFVSPGAGTPGYYAFIFNTTIVGNRAKELGAGVFWAVNKHPTNIQFQLTYLTVADNAVMNPQPAVAPGAGIYVFSGVNQAVVYNSVLWNNTVADDTASDLSGGTVGIASSLVTSDASVQVADDSGLIVGDPLLGELGDNGGPRIGANGAYYLPTRRPVWNSPVAGVQAYPDSQLPAPYDVDELGAKRGTPAVWGALLAANRPPSPAPVIPPSAPLSVAGIAGDRSATVTWSPPASSGSFPVTTYQAVVSPGGATCLVVSAPCTITGLTNGVEYTVAVRALSGAGWGAFSSPSTPFTPQAPPVEKSIVITGTRGDVRGKPGVIVSGETTGLVGTQVAPWVKFPGQTSYAEGAARPTVDAQGDFTWQRQTGKKIYVYFRTTEGDVRSNRIIIRAR